jgi:hypothetical protein
MNSFLDIELLSEDLRAQRRNRVVDEPGSGIRRTRDGFVDLNFFLTL